MQTAPLHNIVVLASALCATFGGAVYVFCSRPNPQWTRSYDVSSPVLPFHQMNDVPAGLENVIVIGQELFSGSEPQGEAGFAGLERLGVRTIVSVDGSQPHVESAHEHGMQYVHIPLGYDGIPPDSTAMLAAAMKSTTGPWYVHCHHGRHRGPAAVAVMCLASGRADKSSAKRLLGLAGTGREYPGLWRDVAGFQPRPADAPQPKLVEIAEVEGLVTAMVQIDRHFDQLKLSREAHWNAPANHPDLVPHQEAVLVHEGLREALRHSSDGRTDEFREWLTAARDTAEQIVADLAADQNAGLPHRVDALQQSCKTCHAKYRN